MSSAAAHPLLHPTDRDAFVATLSGIVEHSPWVAAEAYEQAPFDDLSALHTAFADALLAASYDAQIAVLRAHPDLAVDREQPVPLTAESASEQAGAGLDRLEEARRLELSASLGAYRAKFGFPFIVCVRNHGGAGLEELVAARVSGTPEQELQTALGEVTAIARYRLADLVQEGDA